MKPFGSVSTIMGSLLLLSLENTHDGWHVSQILKGILRLIAAQLGQWITPCCYLQGAGPMGLRTGDIAWLIADDKRLLSRNGMSQENLRAFLGNRYQSIAGDV